MILIVYISSYNNNMKIKISKQKDLNINTKIKGLLSFNVNKPLFKFLGNG